MSAQADLASPDFSTRPSLTLKRRLSAAPEAVFAAWTDPEKLMRWFGPAHVEIVGAEADARVGGRYDIVMRTPADGEEHRVGGVYREVVQDRRLVFTWAWHSTPERESLVTVLLGKDGDGTLLTLIHEQLHDEAARDRHRAGWTGTLDKLEKHFA